MPRKNEPDTGSNRVAAFRIEAGDLVVVSRSNRRELHTAEVLESGSIRAGSLLFDALGRCLTDKKISVRLPDHKGEWDEAEELIAKMAQKIRSRRHPTGT